MKLKVRLPGSGDIFVTIEDRGIGPAQDADGKEFTAQTSYVTILRDFYVVTDVRVPMDHLEHVKKALISLGYEVVD